MQSFFIRRDGERIGPFTLEEINRHLADGSLQPTDLGWSEISPGWKPLLSFTGVLMPGAASSTSAPLNLATPFQPPPQDFAGFWIRLAAGAIDAVVLAFVAIVLVFIFRAPNEKMSILRDVAIFAVCFFYMPLMWASGYEATLGQHALGLRVMRTNGAPISFARAVQRAFGVVISVAAFGAGFFAVAFSNRKLAWHDRWADTYLQSSTF